MLWAPNRRVVVVTSPRIATGRFGEYPAHMAGYAATERITRARPRFVGTGLGRTKEGAVIEGAAGPRDAHQRDMRPLDERLVERWSEMREEWAQATFFLFDPNSWR
jgi:hypothetical protein